MARGLSSTIEQWAEAPDISARSVLVTIIGDTLVPIGSSIWVSQMLRLSECFGFTDRLVRTSMNRLVAEDWLYTERVGRQSRYHMTELAFAESAQASQRIYGVEDPDWSGDWVLLFLPTTLPAPEFSRIREHFSWNGFVPVSSRVLAAPGVKPESARELMQLVDQNVRPVIATATFTELAELVEDGFFIAESDSDDLAAAYLGFVDRYGPVHSSVVAKPKGIEPIDAFGLRTMLVHDLRRIRLRWPELPVQARPADWPGDRAAEIAATLYESTVARSSEWLSSVFDLEYPNALPTRFAPSYDPHTERP